MAEYPYSPELKKPLAAGDVDFLDPKTQKTLETVISGQNGHSSIRC